MKRLHTLLLALVLLTTHQQTTPELPLTLQRNFGYGGGSRIQGTFTLDVPDASGLIRVEFIIDGQVVYVDTEPPFSLRFNTADYGLGVHILAARGTTQDGQQLVSAEIRKEFLSAEAAWRSTIDLIVPILVLAVALVALSALVPVLFRPRGGYRPGEYGLAGGAICRRCGLPFSRHALSPNLLAGKLERCPHCGKWGIVRRASRDELASAEARLVTANQQGTLQVDDAEERLRRAIDDSRFEE